MRKRAVSFQEHCSNVPLPIYIFSNRLREKKIAREVPNATNGACVREFGACFVATSDRRVREHKRRSGFVFGAVEWASLGEEAATETSGTFFFPTAPKLALVSFLLIAFRRVYGDVLQLH